MQSLILKSTRGGLVGGLALSATVFGSADVRPAAAAVGKATTPVWVTTQGKVVHLTLIANWNNTNSGFNFNGAAHGQMTVTVPVGDTVDATFKNNGQGTQHDVVVIPYTKSLPSSSASPAFPGAASPTPRFGQGGPSQGASAAQTFSFVAGKAGNYMLVCGIGGHAIAGMWDNLVISSTAKTASVAFSTAQATGSAGTTAAPANPSQWVSTSGKTVHLTLIAGYNNANAGFNFNGGAKGRMVVTVPLGAKVVATYKNNATTPHDVLVVPYQKSLPTHSVPTAFAGASAGRPNFGSGRPGAGGPPSGGGSPQTSNKPQTFTFVANKAGTYMIICGFPGHAIAGMWDTFIVSNTAKTASITFK